MKNTNHANKYLENLSEKLGRKVLRATGLCAILVSAFTSCKDVPFMPRWDIDTYMPLGTSAVYLNDFFTFGLIPSGISAKISSVPKKYEMYGALRDALRSIETDSARARTVLTLSFAKRTPIYTTDTLFISSDSSGLNNYGKGNIIFPISLETTDTLKTDSIILPQESINMLQNAAGMGNPLWIQTRGYVSNQSSSSIKITSADSMNVNLDVTARIFVSQSREGQQ